MGWFRRFFDPQPTALLTDDADLQLGSRLSWQPWHRRKRGDLMNMPTNESFQTNGVAMSTRFSYKYHKLERGFPGRPRQTQKQRPEPGLNTRLGAAKKYHPRIVLTCQNSTPGFVVGSPGSVSHQTSKQSKFLISPRSLWCFADGERVERSHLVPWTSGCAAWRQVSAACWGFPCELCSLCTRSNDTRKHTLQNFKRNISL